MVGTMRKNKRSIPPKLLEYKKVPLYHSTFAFTESITLVSYVGRKDNCVVLQSTMHHSNDVESDAKKLPKIIQFYNKTKGGVDTVDKMLSCYISKRKTNRLSVAVFLNIVDISALNAYIIFKDINQNWKTNKPILRRVFLSELGTSLTKPYMVLSAINQSDLVDEPSGSITQSREPFGAQQSLSQSFEIPSKNQKTIPPIIEGKSRCHICYSEKPKYRNYIHQTMCCFCKKGVCKRAHNRNVCEKCIEHTRKLM